jgi:uncharacterized protein with GYD domain
MPTYVLMTKLGPGETAGGRSRRERGREWMARVERLCPGIQWVAHFALLGAYDFMDIYEAPDEATAFKVSLLSRAEGAVSAESWPATRYEDFLRLHEEVARVESGKKSGKKR